MFDDKISKAKIKLLHKKYKLAYFGILLYNFNIVCKELNPNVEGCILFDNNKDIFLNSIYLNKDDFTHNNCAWLMLHELLHIIHYHKERLNGRDIVIWNIAADHCIERDLQNLVTDTGIEPYKQNYNIIQQLHDEHPKCTTEEVYDWIKNNPDKISYSQNGDSIDVSDDDNSWSVTIENKISDTNLTEFIVHASTLYESMKEKGEVSSNLSELIEQFIKTEVPWDDILNRKLKNNIIKKAKPSSWITPKKSLLPIVYLPGEILKNHKDKISEIIITVDSSASMSKNDLKRIAYIIHDSMKRINKVHVIVHDTDIKDYQIFKDQKIFLKYVKDIGFKGRGGTSHRKAFDWIENFWYDNKNTLSIVIAITDGDSDLEKIENNYKWIKNNVQLVILLTRNKKLKFDHTNIEVIPVK